MTSRREWPRTLTGQSSSNGTDRTTARGRAGRAGRRGRRPAAAVMALVMALFGLMGLGLVSGCGKPGTAADASQTGGEPVSPQFAKGAGLDYSYAQYDVNHAFWRFFQPEDGSEAQVSTAYVGRNAKDFQTIENRILQDAGGADSTSLAVTYDKKLSNQYSYMARTFIYNSTLDDDSYVTWGVYFQTSAGDYIMRADVPAASSNDTSLTNEVESWATKLVFPGAAGPYTGATVLPSVAPSSGKSPSAKASASK